MNERIMGNKGCRKYLELEGKRESQFVIGGIWEVRGVGIIGRAKGK